MAIVRVNKTNDYTVISNYHFKEKEMSLKAKGLLSLMLSLPEGWDFSITGLVALSADGKDSVMTALNEIEKFGYLVRTRQVDEKGKFAGYDYDIYEKPKSENPYADNPYAENPQQYNTKQSSTYINKKENTKEKDGNGEKLVDGDAVTRWFGNIWDIYPRKIDKVQAKKTFEHKVVGLPYEEAHKIAVRIYRMLQQQVAIWTKNETEMQYIKHCSSWLNANVEDSPNYKRGKKR